MNRTKVSAALLLTAVALVAAAPMAAAATVPTTAHLTNIQVQANATYDRVELDFDSLPTYSWQFTDQLYYASSGKPYSLPGNTYIDLEVQGASASDDSGNRTYTGPTKFTTPQLTNVKAVGITGDYERTLGLGIGLDHTAGVHVSALTGPNRLVIDVDH
jgi:hypothetical protein